MGLLHKNTIPCIPPIEKYVDAMVQLDAILDGLFVTVYMSLTLSDDHWISIFTPSHSSLWWITIQNSANWTAPYNFPLF